MIVAAPPRLRERAARQERTTPAHLEWLMLTIGIASGALAIIGTGALFIAQRAVADMHHGTVQAIVGAQRIHATLADADRAEANAFIAGATEAVRPHRQYESDIAQATRELDLAAEQAGGNAAVSEQIQSISVSVAQYTTLVDIARADNGQGYPVGAAYLREASLLMHRPDDGGILFKVDQLGNLGVGDLDNENLTLLVAVALVLLYAVAAYLLLRQLMHAQRYVKERFRRRRNSGLLGATVLLGLLSVAIASEGVFTGQMLFVAEGQSYSRLLNLWHMRALVYDANGNESLSLIARGNGDAFDRAFQVETTRLADRPVTDVLVNQAASGDVRFQGLLADELNGSSGGERQDAVAVLRAYRVFMGVDATVRARSQQGDHDSAATLALGFQPGQLGAAFTTLDATLGRAINDVQSQFDLSISLAEYSLLVSAVAQLMGAAIALLAYRGLKPRVDEYRA